MSPRGRRPQPVDERFWSKVQFGDWMDCWIWTAHTDRKGYGRFQLDGVNRMAYAVAYELLVGPIPEGLVLDHVKGWGCTSTLCVNPLHLEPVTRQENSLRGDNPFAVNARKTHCPRGHPYDRVDAVGRRVCLTCAREASRRCYLRSRAGVVAVTR